MSTNINGQTVFKGNEIYNKIAKDVNVKAYNKGDLINPNATDSTVLGNRAKEIINGFISRYNPNADVFSKNSSDNFIGRFDAGQNFSTVYLTEKEVNNITSAVETAVDFVNYTDSKKNYDDAIAGNKVEDFTMIKDFKKGNSLGEYKKSSQNVISLFDKNNNGLMEKEEFIQFATGGLGINGTVDNNVKEFCETMQSILLDNTVDPKAILGENEEEISEKLKLFSNKEQEQLFGKKLDLTKSGDVEIVRKIFNKLVTNDLDTHFNNLAGLDSRPKESKEQENTVQNQVQDGRRRLFSDNDLILDTLTLNEPLFKQKQTVSIVDIMNEKTAKTTISADELRAAFLAADCMDDPNGDFDGKISYNAWQSLADDLKLDDEKSIVKQSFDYAKGVEAEKAASKTEEQKNAELKAQVKDVTSKIQQYYQYKDKEVKETGNNNVNNNGMSFYQINNKRNMFFNEQYALVDGKFVMVDNSTPEGQARLEISSLLRQNKFTEQDLGITNTYGTQSKYNNDLQKSYQDTASKNYNTEMTRIKTELKDVKGLNLLISEIESQKSAIKKEDYKQLNELTAKIRNLNINSVTGGNNMRNEWFAWGNWNNSALNSITAAGKDYKLVYKNGEIVKESTVKQTETAKVAQPATDTIKKGTVAVNTTTAKKTTTPAKTATTTTAKKTTTPAISTNNNKAAIPANNNKTKTVTKPTFTWTPTTGLKMTQTTTTVGKTTGNSSLDVMLGLKKVEYSKAVKAEQDAMRDFYKTNPKCFELGQERINVYRSQTGINSAPAYASMASNPDDQKSRAKLTLNAIANIEERQGNITKANNLRNQANSL